MGLGGKKARRGLSLLVTETVGSCMESHGLSGAQIYRPN